MKLRSVFLILFLSAFSIALLWSVFYLVNSGQASFNHQVEDYLISVINSNEERIRDVFSEVERDALFLVESEKVKDILKKNIAESKEATKADVKGKVHIVAKEVENYILAHPDMTLDELVKNNEFRSIATQKIGETGYAIIIGAEDRIMYVHIDPKMEGVAMIGAERSTGEIDAILQEAVEEGVAEGFYDWVDIDGETRRKYTEIRKIGTETADGKALLSVTTAYVDDYLVAQNVSKSLDNYFVKLDVLRGYHNILFLSKDNRVVYMSGDENGLGSKLEDVANGFEGVSSFVDGLNDRDVGFYGPFVGHIGEHLQFTVASRVYDGEEFLGTIVIVEEMDVINEILEEEEDIQAKLFDEDYIVNEHGLLITPLRARNVDLMVQEIRTESVEECLGVFLEAAKMGITAEEYEIFEQEEGMEEPVLSFLNYNGDLTLGLHRPIDRVNWCILSEVSAEDVLSEPMEKSFKNQIVFRLWVMFVVVVLVIVISLFIDKRYVLKKKKKVFKGNFFTRLELKYYLLFAIVFAAMYLFIITSFFQGIQNAKLFDAVPDMLAFVVGVMFFAIGVKIRDVRVRYFIMYGGLLICIRRLFDIPFQEYQVIVGHLLTPWLWVPVLIAEFMGFLLLFIGYRRLKNA